MKRITKTQRKAVEAMQAHGTLVKWRGGFWTGPHTSCASHDATVPAWYFGTQTIEALLRAGLVTPPTWDHEAQRLWVAPVVSECVKALGE